MHQFSRPEAEAHFARLVFGWSDHLDPNDSRLIIDGKRNIHDYGGSYEGVTRMLPALGGWLSQPSRSTTLTWKGRTLDLAEVMFRAVVNGTDPASPGFWGWPGNAANPSAKIPGGGYEQRTVESAQVAFSIWHARKHIWDACSPTQRENIFNWLQATGIRPDHWRSNWSLFWALNHRVRQDFGLEFDATLLDSVLDYLDSVYVGDGWYDDGPRRGTNHFDDYNFIVFASHVLQLNMIERGEHPRFSELLERIRLLMQHAPYFFAANGAYTEYGRSLSYKCARLGSLMNAYQAGVWSHSAGMLKRLFGRHLRWYVDRGAIRADGSLRQELTSEGSPDVRETYISTGATYFAMHAFGGLWSLPDDDPFWDVEEEPLPVEQEDFVKVFPQPGFVCVGTKATGHVQRFSSVSAHVPAKYSKFVYSTAAPFNAGLSDGRELPDAMLSLRLGDDWGHKHAVGAWATGESGWLHMRYTQHVGGADHKIETILVPLGEQHIRIHRVSPSMEGITAIDGAAALGFPAGDHPRVAVSDLESRAIAGGVMVAIRAVSGFDRALHPSSYEAPSANAVFGNQLIPALLATEFEEPLVSVVHIGAPVDNLDIVASVTWTDSCEITLRDGQSIVVPPLP